MMEWLAEDLKRGQTVLTFIALGITVVLIWLGVVWLGRKRILITISVALAWLLLAAIAIPSFIPARNVAYRNACINNLRQIEKAKVEWAATEHKLPVDIPTLDDLCGTNKFLRYEPICQLGGKYTIGAVNEKPTCSLGDKKHKLE